MRPKIYICVDEDYYGDHAWLYRDDLGYELVDKCFHEDLSPWASCFRSVKEATEYGRKAKALMEQNGALGKVTVNYWRLVGNGLVRTSFNKNGRIVKQAKRRA